MRDAGFRSGSAMLNVMNIVFSTPPYVGKGSDVEAYRRVDLPDLDKNRRPTGCHPGQSVAAAKPPASERRLAYLGNKI